MELTIHNVKVIGVDIDEETRCAHYHDQRDIVAIKFRCCGGWYACHACHTELVGHAAAVWPKGDFAQRAILCGSCGDQMTVSEYLGCESACPRCAHPFNPGCANHYHLYFSRSD